MSYQGSGVYTNYMTLGWGGEAAPTATSEQIPVLVDNTTTYSAQIEAAPSLAPWSSGYTITLTFYSNANVVEASETATVTNLLTGVHTTASTTPTVAPSGCANGGYCVAQVTFNGSPASTNLLEIFRFAVATGSNTNIPDVVNYNYAFANGTWPWAGSNDAILAAVTVPGPSGANGNYDSLVIGGIIEIMGGPGGVPSTVPGLVDQATGQAAAFRISTPGGQLQTLSQSGAGPYDLGDPQPTQDFVESLLLDGERPFGARTSNRTMTIPIGIYAPSQQTLCAARDYLLSVIDQQTFEMASTPAANGLTTIYECFRALPSVIMYGFNNNREGANGAPAVGLVTVSIQALPFGKSASDGLVEIDFSSGLVAGSPAASAVVIDNFTGTIDSSDGWLSNTQYPVIGSNCVFKREPSPIKSPYPAFKYVRTGLTGINITGLPVLSVWLGQSYDSSWPSDPSFVSNVTVTCTLTDVNGNRISFSTTANKVAWNANSTKPTWTQVSLPIPQKQASFSYNNVAGYTLYLSNWTGGGQAGYVRMNAWLGYVSAQPQAITNTASPRGILYNMFGLVGSARSQINAQVQLPNADPMVQEFTQSGTYQVPAGVTSLEAECWGGGGAGASVSTTIPGGGGGGGEYAMEPSLAVTPGQKIPVTVGTGGTPAQVSPTVQSYTAHGVITSWVCPANVTSAIVECWGGGAAGTPGGGGGGAGGYTLNQITVVPGTTYSMYVGNGGAPNTGTTSQALASRNGGNTWFGPKGTTAIAGAWAGAYGGQSVAAGSGNGGIGGAGRVSGNSAAYVSMAWRGGSGGRSPGGAGGGGGGAGGPSGPGGAGAASPKLGSSGAGDYLTGGAGGTGDAGTGTGGGGGTGANVPGAANGGFGPGGGGGGGYTRTVVSSGKSQAVNYQGGPGAPGEIRVTYYVGSARQVNGTATTFGSASTTGTVVTANGGMSVPADTGVGAAGGSGSSNSYHHNGGNGGLNYDNFGMLLAPGASSGYWSAALGTGTASAATQVQVTSGATISAAQIESGVMLVLGVMSSAQPSGPVVTDTAGNTYYQAAQQALTDGSYLTVFVSPLTYPVASGNTITLTNATSQNFATVWGALFGVRDLEDEVIASNAGNSATPQYTRTYPDTSAVYLQLTVSGNDGGGNENAGQDSYPGIAAFTFTTNGNLGIDFSLQLTTGSAYSLTTGGLSGASMPWALIALPFIASKQVGQAINIVNRQGVSASTKTITVGGSSQISANTAVNSVNLDAGSGYHVVKIHVASTATVSSVTDSAGNTYTSLGSVAVGSGNIFYYGAPVTDSLTIASGTGWTLTVTLSASNAFTVDSFFVPQATGADTTGTATNTGSGTAVSLNLPSTTDPATLQVVTVGYPGSSELTAGANTWTGGVTSGPLNQNSSFETGISPWTGSFGATCLFSTVKAYQGSASMRISFAGGNAASNAESEITIPVTAGTTYTASTWLSANIAWSSGCNLQVLWYNASGTYLSQNASSNVAITTGWTQISVTAAAPSGAAYAALVIQTVGTPTVNLLVYADVAQIASVANQTGVLLTYDANSTASVSDDTWAVQQNGYSAPVFSTTLSTSESWGAIALSLVIPAYSGGGGSSGGTGGPGSDAAAGPSGGAPSYTLGGKGANGLNGSNNGSVGATPGGGGSGAARASGTTVYTGGNGGNGMVRVTTSPPLVAFNDFLLHKPGLYSPADFNPLVPIPPSDAPNNIEYVVPQVIAGRNARYSGTYSIYLCAASWDTPANVRTISVTINQYEYPGGPAVSMQATRTITPATDVINGYASMGPVTLPIKQIDSSNSDCYYTVSIHDTDQNDSFQDLLILDTQGQLVLVNIAPGTAGDSQYSNYYVDVPGPDTDLGKLLGSSHERDRAISVLDMAVVTGGPLFVGPGNNLLLVYSSKGAPNLKVTYPPRWYSDRVV